MSWFSEKFKDTWIGAGKTWRFSWTGYSNPKYSKATTKELTEKVQPEKKSKFLTELQCQLIKGDTLWEVLSILKYKSQFYGGLIEVQAGFVTDFASVPRVPIVYTLFGNRAHRESVIHDYLYQTHLTSKDEADKIFLEAMEARGKSFAVRWAMYMGVVLGGHSSYKSGPERFTLFGNKQADLDDKED